MTLVHSTSIERMLARKSMMLRHFCADFLFFPAEMYVFEEDSDQPDDGPAVILDGAEEGEAWEGEEVEEVEV